LYYHMLRVCAIPTLESTDSMMSKIWKGIWRKTIIVVSLTKKGTGSSKTNPHVDYKVVTQVFAKLDETMNNKSGC